MTSFVKESVRLGYHDGGAEATPTAAVARREASALSMRQNRRHASRAVARALALLALAVALMGASAFSESDHERGFVTFQRSTLKRISPQSWPAPGETPASLHMQAAWDEYEPLQVGVHAVRELTDLRVTVTDLRHESGRSIPASALDVRMVRFYGQQLSIRIPNRFGVVPKTLEPTAPLQVPAGRTRPYWITVHVPDGVPGGLYRGTVTVQAKQAREELPLELEVLPLRLDEPQILLGPLSVSVLRNYPKMKGPEAEHALAQADLVFRDIRAHGMTTMSLWSGTVARLEKDDRVVLPDLDAALELYKRHRFPQPLLYAPVNVLNTNKIGTSSNYKRYDPSIHVHLAASIARQYTRRATEAGIPGIIFDPVEEPNFALGVDRSDPPESRQRIAAQLLKTIKEAGGATAMTCTPETARVGEGYLDYWLVAYKRFVPGVFAQAERAKARVGMYANGTLMGNNTYFSRFFFGYYPWATRLQAMMAWTYPMLPKRFPQNAQGLAEGPFKVVGGFLGTDGKPIPVIQWELAREGVDDFRYLVTLERWIERARRSDNEEAKRAADEGSAFLASLRSSISTDPHLYAFEDAKTLEPVPAADWDEARFAATRKRSFDLIKRIASLLEGRVP